jgi:hypothetical protein
MVYLNGIADTRDHDDFTATENARASAGNHTEFTPGALEGLAVGSR